MKPNYLIITMLLLISGMVTLNTLAQDFAHPILDGHEDRVYSVAFSPDGATLASGSRDDTVILWDVSSGKQIDVLHGHDRRIYSVAFSPDSRMLASGSGDSKVILWDVASRKQIAILHGHKDEVYSVAFSPDGRTLASGSEDNKVILWDVASRKRSAVLKEHEDWVYSVAFSPDGRTLASGSGDSKVILWDVASRKQKHTFNEPKTRVYSVAFSPDGRTLASSHWDDRTVILWDVIHKGKKNTLVHAKMVYSVAFSPDSQTLASGSGDDTVILWDIANGKQIDILDGHKDKVYSVAFSPDGRTLASGSWDRTVILWSLTSPASSLGFLTPPKNILVNIEQESQEIYDSNFGWSEGNSNGVIEVGERIKLKVTLKNTGKITAFNVKGTLSTTDDSVHIFDDEVNYGNISSNSLSPVLFPPKPFEEFEAETFKFEIEDNVTTHDVPFTLTVTADNGGPFTISINLRILNPSEIDLKFPRYLVSEKASSRHSTYFILKAQHPTLTAILNEDAYYGDCTITLHIPEDTQPFLFPIGTGEKQVFDAGSNLLINIAIEAADTAKDIGKRVASQVLSVALTVLDLIDLFSKVRDWLFPELNLKIHIQTLAPNQGQPDTEIEYVVLLKNKVRSLESINITIEQEYGIGNAREIEKIAVKSTWNFQDGWNAPAEQPLTLSDYPPFQSLPPEVQEYLLYQFWQPETAEAWQVPEKTTISQNYPNPFNPETWIPYQLADAADATLTIYNLQGIVVRRLALGHRPAGFYHGRTRAAYWDGKNALGEPVASGVYFYKLVAGEFSATRKMLIRK